MRLKEQMYYFRICLTKRIRHKILNYTYFEQTSPHNNVLSVNYSFALQVGKSRK